MWLERSDLINQLGLEQRFADIDGRLLSYVFRDGSPLLLLIPGSHQDFRQYVDMIASLDKGLGLFIVELPGHGESQQVPTDPSIERFAQDIVDIIEKCALSDFFVAGHSIGGMISLELGRRSPAGLLGVIAIEGWTNWHVADEALGGQESMYNTLSPEQLQEQQTLRDLATGHRTEAERQMLSGLWTRWSGEDFLKTTSLPVLELWGDRGRPRPELTAMRIPVRQNISLKWFNNASHNLPLEQPAELAESIAEFIQQYERTKP